MKTYALAKPAICLLCGKTLEGIFAFGHDEPPSDGSVCACIRCGAVAQWKAGELCGFTDAEIAALESEPETMATLYRVVKGIQIVRAMKG